MSHKDHMTKMRAGQKRVAQHLDRIKRREDARVRQEARDARSPQEQLDLLVERGHGHCAEADRLRKEVESE